MDNVINIENILRQQNAEREFERSIIRREYDAGNLEQFILAMGFYPFGEDANRIRSIAYSAR